MSIIRLIKRNTEKGPDVHTATETVRKIARALDKLDAMHAKFVACFAYLLSRAARADLEISGEETSLMEKIVMDKGGLPEEQAMIVVQMAKTQSLLFGGTENYLVAREFRDAASYRERLALVDCLFAVAASHDSISTLEDNEISQIADELRVEHGDFISIRSRYRDHLAVLKK
ncbi:MAG: TerB family tellurite resistance protein [Acidobacteria bacterium]|nr:TerB family tellurite resistance protein [Acidobacteriota bacterium]